MTRHEARQADSLDRALNERKGQLPDSEGGDLGGLVALADELQRTLNPPPASPAVQARIETRLMSQLRLGRRQAAVKPRTSSGPVLLRRAVAALLAVSLAAGLTGGSALAASHAVPGDALYPVKLAGESVQLALSPSDELDATLLLHFADVRLKETSHLLTHGRESLAVQTLRHYDDSMAHLETIVSGLTDRSGLEPARVALGQQRKEIQDLLADAPPAVVPALQQAERHASHAEDSLSPVKHDLPTEPPGPLEPTRTKVTPPGQEIKATKQSGQGQGADHSQKGKKTPTPPP
jgi:hypothetical protein